MTASPLIVLERTVQLHALLQAAGIRHGVGGALALGYHTQDPRATSDIDLNISLPKEEAGRLFDVLPADVQRGPADVTAALRDGQVRLWWPVPEGPAIPLDLFFAEHAFHAVVDQRVEWVPMLGSTVPILSATDLVVFKTLFDRTKDWADIEEMVLHASPSLDLAEAAHWVTLIVGAQDERVHKLAALQVTLEHRQPPPTASELFGRKAQP